MISRLTIYPCKDPPVSLALIRVHVSLISTGENAIASRFPGECDGSVGLITVHDRLCDMLRGLKDISIF